jgi:glycosyltransferase involved in cell wall biosynthesis
MKVLSLYWGYSIGGVGKYGTLIDKVSQYENVEIEHVCILSDDWHCDLKTLKLLETKTIKITSRFDFSWIGKLKKIIKASNATSIMTHGFNGHAVVLLCRVLKIHNLPMLVSYHGLYHGTTNLRNMIAPLFNTLTELHIKYFAHAVISVSQYSQNYLISKGVKQEKVSVIHNGIPDIEKNSESKGLLRKEWGIEENEILLGVASRIDPVKGISYLIDALPNLLKENKNIKLVIIGTGTEEDKLKNKCVESRISDKVIFTGFRSDIQECLEAFDIFILPSLAEYHSIGLIEAMRATKKIVVTDVGGNTESVRHLKEGYVISSKSSKQLEESISYLILNEKESMQMAINARSRFEQEFLEESMISKTAKWFVNNTIPREDLC